MKTGEVLYTNPGTATAAGRKSWEGIWTNRALFDQVFFFTFDFDFYMPKVYKKNVSKFGSLHLALPFNLFKMAAKSEKCDYKLS